MSCPVFLGMTEKQTIKELMKTANVTQQELADMLGVKQSTVADMLNPKSNPKLSTLRRIAKALKVDVATLIDGYHDSTAETEADSDPQH
jgi:transcriptional regulator with XRE-family HTH domain